MLPRAFKNSSRKASCSASRRLNLDSSKCPSTAVPQEVHCNRTASRSELQTGHFPGACGIGADPPSILNCVRACAGGPGEHAIEQGLRPVGVLSLPYQPLPVGGVKNL